LSMHPTERYAIRALRSGAAGYLTKSGASDELIMAVRKVATGGRFISEAVAEELAANLGSKDGGMAHQSLSDREFQVFLLLAEGRSAAEVAGFLGLSSNTVHTYRRRVLTKLRLRTNSELSVYALRHGLID